MNLQFDEEEDEEEHIKKKHFKILTNEISLFILILGLLIIIFKNCDEKV